MQNKAPVEGDILPAGQIEHVPIVKLPKLPIGQDEIHIKPKLSENVPVGHATQLVFVDDVTVPGEHKRETVTRPSPDCTPCSLTKILPVE